MLTKNPSATKWKSTKYRRFIRDHQVCCAPKCGVHFLDEPETYEAHHHKPRGSHGSTGGKRPSDHLLVPLCRRHHSAFHMNVKEMQFDEAWWLEAIIRTLISYVNTLDANSLFIMVNALQQVAEEMEK